jgi:hypothetical protein
MSPRRDATGGVPVRYASLQGWLCPSVTPQGCPMPLRSPEDLGAVWTMALSPDEQTVATSSMSDDTVSLWGVMVFGAATSRARYET